MSVQTASIVIRRAGLWTALKIFEEATNPLAICVDKVSHVREQPPLSAYISGYSTPHLSQNPLDRDGRKGILIKKEAF